MLWEKGYLGDSTLKVLQRMCYLLGVHLGLRGGDEQRCLEYGKQLKLQSTINGEVLILNEYGSKTNSGGLFHRKRNKRENVTIYSNQSNPNRCSVTLYKKYVSLRPKHCTTTAYLWINLKLVTYMLTYPSEGIGLHCILWSRT